MEATSNPILVHQSAHRTNSAPSSGEMMSNSVIDSCPNGQNTTEEEHHHHRSIINPYNTSDDGGNQSDSSNSNSSLASSPRYNERYPKTLRRSSSTGRSTGNTCSSSRGSFAVLGSRTSLPPLDENCTLDANESQLSLNLRRATRSTSWTNQKILDAIDGLNTNIEDVDPCLALGAKVPISTSYTAAVDETIPKPESSRQGSLEKFVLPKSISNLVMKSRSSGSVNPPTSTQNRENSCYNFLSGIREDEDEEQHQDSSTSSNAAAGIRLAITQTSIPFPTEEKRKNFIARGGESAKTSVDKYVHFPAEDKSGASLEQNHSKHESVNRKDDTVKRKEVIHHQHKFQPQESRRQHQESNFVEQKAIASTTQGDPVDVVDKQNYHKHPSQKHNQNAKTITQPTSTCDYGDVNTNEEARNVEIVVQEGCNTSKDHYDCLDNNDRKSRQAK